MKVDLFGIRCEIQQQTTFSIRIQVGISNVYQSLMGLIVSFNVSIQTRNMKLVWPQIFHYIYQVRGDQPE